MIEYKSVELKKKTFNKIFSKNNLFHYLKYGMYTHVDRIKNIRKEDKYRFYTSNTLSFGKKHKDMGNWYGDLESTDKVGIIKEFIESLIVYNNEVYYIELETQIRTEEYYYSSKLKGLQPILPQDGWTIFDATTNGKPETPDPGKLLNASEFNTSVALTIKLNEFDDRDVSYSEQMFSNPDGALFDFIYNDVRVILYKFYNRILISTESTQEGRQISIELMSKFVELVKSKYDEVPRKVEYKMSFVVNQGSLRLITKVRESDLQFDDSNFINKYYNNNVGQFHNNLLTSIQNKGKGLYLIHGLPGSGKTSYIEYLTYLLAKDERQVVYLPADNISFFSDPSFSGFALEDLKDTIIVVEDAEEVLTSNGKRNTATSTLLQLTDGFLSKFINCVIIATFNTEIRNIDKALKRDGRLKDTIEIGELEPEKIEALKKEFNITKDGKTLAELFNNKPNEYQQVNNKIGF